MQLIKNTSAAVAVTDELTTLIDWTKVDQFSGLTVMIENASGGSASDITDIQIDTSVDGGVTILADQHAGVPAVPVEAGLSIKGTFTTTAAYVRLRALCATDEDTTANAWLMADSSALKLCSLGDVKDRLGIDNTNFDTLITTIITGLEAQFNRFCDRDLIAPAADVTEYYFGQGKYLQLNQYPIISITSIKQSYFYDFDNADAIVANTDYRLMNSGKKGLLYKMYNGWYSDPDSIQVIYKGGYQAAGDSAVEGLHPLPADIREAAIMQASFIYKRKDDLGVNSVSYDGGSKSYSKIELLPAVQDILKTHRRPSL